MYFDYYHPSVHSRGTNKPKRTNQGTNWWGGTKPEPVHTRNYRHLQTRAGRKEKQKKASTQPYLNFHSAERHMTA